jgi:hypothetical protein
MASSSWESWINAMFLKTVGSKIILVGAIGLALLLIASLWDLYGNLAEQRHRREALINGKDATALVLASTGLQSVTLSWTDINGQSRTGEARTRKQVSSDRRFVGERVAIKYLVDPSFSVILSEVEDRENENSFWINSNLWVAGIIMAVLTLIGFQIVKRKPR